MFHSKNWEWHDLHGEQECKPDNGGGGGQREASLPVYIVPFNSGSCPISVGSLLFALFPKY